VWSFQQLEVVFDTGALWCIIPAGKSRGEEMANASEYLCVALDTASLDEALKLTERLAGRAGFVKVGLELFSAAGPDSVEKLSVLGLKVFLDLKLHDIPNTVARAVRSCTALGASLLTLHASGGPAMISAARKAAQEAASVLSIQRPRLLAVTVLTSLDKEALSQTLGLKAELQELVLHLARLAKDAGADGIVCSAREVEAVKKACGKDFFTVTPGIRHAGADTGDQKRVTTPADAIRAGSDLLVMGRPITAAPDPAAAADEILESIKEALE
jgi:orotidine-5'-phosphate decarboxylase